jgi:aspartate kinase
MSHTVEKIGGRSIADTQTILGNVLLGARAGAALYGRVFVVSAYAGMTDRLLEHKKTGEAGVYRLFAGAGAWEQALMQLARQMTKKNGDIFGEGEDLTSANEFVCERLENVRACLADLERLCASGPFTLSQHLATVREMLAGLGEAHAAHNTALLLRSRGVNAIAVDLTGWRDEEELSLDERILATFADMDFQQALPIVTGYVRCTEGMAKTYDRGYTEVTLSRIAALTGAREAIIHKEFHLSSADPKLVGADRVRKIGCTNYDVADQLSNMGMEAVHPKAAKRLRQAGIPLRVKNTFDINDEGTVIEAGFVSDGARVEIVTGLQNALALELFEQDMVGVKGYDAEVLNALTRHGIRIVSKCSNANTITHYLDCDHASLERAASELRAVFESAEIAVKPVAIVSVIGSDLDLRGLVAAAAGALDAAGIELLGIAQIPRRVDLQLIVAPQHFGAAVKALHARLLEADEQSTHDLRTAA